MHESLVYKGISSTSAVRLKGAEFHIDDTTPLGPLPVSYAFSEPQGSDHSSGSCSPELAPPCTGGALIKNKQPTQQSSWISHIAPDPLDSNPKRTRALVDDLIELVVPKSAPNCPSEWPMHKSLADRSCMRMSSHFHWFLEDFNHWRLPNWGNWAVEYSHPIRIAKGSISPGSTLELLGELILSGPGAGTLEHQLEIID